MKKSSNKKHARLQSLDSAQLAQVAGGTLLQARDCFAEKTGWYEFFDAAYVSSGGCATTGNCGYSSTPIP
jgi:hypothetical protein